MESLKYVLPVLTGVIALIGAAVGLARYFWKVENQATLTRAEQDRSKLETSLEKTRSQLLQLQQQVASVAKAGSIALALKSRLDDKLIELMTAFAASGASVYTPIRGAGGTVHGLNFLSIEPFSPQNQLLKAKIIPLESLAGQCFTSARTTVVEHSAGNPGHYAPASVIADYVPSAPFSRIDADQLDLLAVGVSELVRDILNNPSMADGGNGIFDARAEIGSVVIFDMSNSRLILREFTPEVGLGMLNDYLEQMCQAAIANGATIDNYMGDGALVRFNVPKLTPDHQRAAVNASLAMRDAFYRLRREWLAFAPLLEPVHFRAGIATGPVTRAMVGHSLFQQLTIFGLPISTAAALCAAAPRNRSAILTTEVTVKAAGTGIVCQPYDTSGFPKLAGLADAVCEITASA